MSQVIKRCTLCQEPSEDLYWDGKNWNGYCSNSHCDMTRFVVDLTPEEEALHWLSNR